MQSHGNSSSSSSNKNNVIEKNKIFSIGDVKLHKLQGSSKKNITCYHLHEPLKNISVFPGGHG